MFKLILYWCLKVEYYQDSAKNEMYSFLDAHILLFIDSEECLKCSHTSNIDDRPTAHFVQNFACKLCVAVDWFRYRIPYLAMVAQ